MTKTISRKIWQFYKYEKVRQIVTSISCENSHEPFMSDFKTLWQRYTKKAKKKIGGNLSLLSCFYIEGKTNIKLQSTPKMNKKLTRKKNKTIGLMQDSNPEPFTHESVALPLSQLAFLWIYSHKTVTDSSELAGAVLACQVTLTERVASLSPTHLE